jgi:hypothetical protein
MKKMIVVALCFFTAFSYAQNAPSPVKYLHVTGSLNFGGKAHNLAWSSHPTAGYYKQEYLPKGESSSRFKTMLLMEVVTGGPEVKQAVSAKLAELKALKQANPLVEYEIFDKAKTGEYLLHFLLTAAAPDGKINIAERNVYRYKTFIDKEGKPGVLLFGVSTRAYGSGVSSFLAETAKAKAALVNAVAQLALPQPQL